MDYWRMILHLSDSGIFHRHIAAREGNADVVKYEVLLSLSLNRLLF